MQGLILAAGRGTRMGKISTPKCLLDIGNTSIIKYQVMCLHEFGINEIVIITGYKSNLIKKHLDNNAYYIFHKDYHKTNNLYSMWKAYDILTDDFVCIYSDLFFHKQLLKKCIDSKDTVCLVIDRKVRNETMKVKINNDHIVEVSKSIQPNMVDGNFIGMAKFSNEGRKLLFSTINELTKQGNFDSYYTLAIEHMISKGNKISFIETKDYPWVDIDTTRDLEEARLIYKTMIR